MASAVLDLLSVVDCVDRQMELNKEYKSAGDSLTKWRTEYENTVRGMESCGGRKSAATDFNTKANTLYKQLNRKNLDMLKAYYNTMARLVQYTSTAQSEYLATIESIKSGFLVYLQGMYCNYEVGCIPPDTQAQGQIGALPDFDSVNCEYKDEIYIPPFTVIKTECNIMTTKIELGTEALFEGFEIKLKLGMEENKVLISVKNPQ